MERSVYIVQVHRLQMSNIRKRTLPSLQRGDEVFPYNVKVSGLNRNRPQLPDTPPEILEYLWLIDQLYSCLYAFTLLLFGLHGTYTPS